ncbi:MAG: NUDIX hydrolase [Rubrimonas sp.]|uniref:NUDIX hydrolase n=1 Tax=Rubrimonas sp. TaxID=2036015 RepID=UPI002FDCC338
MTGSAPPTPRDAASLILVRRDGRRGVPRVLMGQRGAGARFMPSKFVFPGGALDPCDLTLSPVEPLSESCARRLAMESGPAIGRALALAAIRETFEEAGLAIGVPDPAAPARADAAPAPWRGFLRRGLRPALDRARFVFRAITPPTRPVRFDARFFMAEATDVQGDPDDFSAAEEELSHLRWLTMSEAREVDLPFITTVVLAEAEARLESDADRPVPFFRHDGGRSRIEALD